MVGVNGAAIHQQFGLQLAGVIEAPADAVAVGVAHADLVAQGVIEGANLGANGLAAGQQHGRCGLFWTWLWALWRVVTQASERASLTASALPRRSRVLQTSGRSGWSLIKRFAPDCRHAGNQGR